MTTKHVLFVTSPNPECGIWEHGEMLREALERVAPEFSLTTIGPEEGLRISRNPGALWDYHLVVVNHQANLHAAWTPHVTRELMTPERAGMPVVVIQHDTFETREIMLGRGLPDFVGACSRLIVHERVGNLAFPGVHYIRQGIYTPIAELPPPAPPAALSPAVRPTVGTVGFPFPWKNYDLLCKCARAAGWNVLLIAPGATVEQCVEWQGIFEGAESTLEIVPQFLPREEVMQRLAACQATAFLYQTGNSGTSGAIRMGFAARRPVIAFKNRQVLDLLATAVGRRAAMWCESEDAVVQALQELAGDAETWIARQSWAAVLAEAESWDRQAVEIAGVFRRALGGEA